jgi:hypothetical protein
MKYEITGDAAKRCPRVILWLKIQLKKVYQNLNRRFCVYSRLRTLLRLCNDFTDSLFDNVQRLHLSVDPWGLFMFIILFLGSWFCTSYSKYVYEYPTRCNDNVLVLLQDVYMFRVPAVPIIRSTVLQLAVTGITYCNIYNFYIKSALKGIFCHIKNINKQGVLAQCNTKY